MKQYFTDMWQKVVHSGPVQRLQRTLEQNAIYAAIKRKLLGSDIASRMASGAFWSIVGTAAGKVFVIVSGILCAHYVLSKEAYGQFGTVKYAITTFAAIGGAGLGQTASKYISSFWREQRERVPSIYLLTNAFALLMALVVTLLLYFFADPIADYITRVQKVPQQSMGDTFRFAAFVLIFVVVNCAQEGVLAGFEDFKGKAIAVFSGSLLQSCTMLAGAWFWGLNGAILGYGAGFVLIACCYKYFINADMRRLGIRLRLSEVRLADFKLVYSFSLPATISSFLIVPVFFIIRLIMVNYMSFAEIADFDIGEQWRVMIVFVPAAVGHIVLPILSSLNGENRSFWKIVNASLLVNGATAAVLGGLVAAFSWLIIRLYGPAYTNPWPMAVLALSSIVMSLTSVLGSSILSRGYVWSACLLNLMWACIVLALTCLFLELGYSTTGVAVAIILSYTALFVVQYAFLMVRCR